MSRFTLNDLESLTGIKTDTIRIWERRYNILSPNRTHTNRRWYDDDDLSKLINVSLLNHNGIKISKLAMMSDSEINDRAAALSENTKTSDNIISSLVIAMNGYNESAVNELIIRSIIIRGFEKTFTDVLFPLLHKVGIMWHTRAIDPSTEHFITMICRQKLIAASDALSAVKTGKSSKILMYLPEGEFHELGLLYFSYIVRKKGHEVLYLGQATPYDSVIEACAAWSPDIVITGIQTELNVAKPAEYLKKLSAALGRQTIFAGGGLAKYAGILKLKNVKALNSEEDLSL